MFLDTVVYIGTRFNEKVVHDVKTYFKQMETFQYTHFTFVKGEALRILQNSSEATFEESIIQIYIKNTWWTKVTHTIWKENHVASINKTRRQRSHLPGHGRPKCGTRWARTHPFCASTHAKIRMVPVSEYKVSTLYSGTKVGTGSLCAHNFCKFRAVHCFVLAAISSCFNMASDRTFHFFIRSPSLLPPPPIEGYPM